MAYFVQEYLLKSCINSIKDYYYATLSTYSTAKNNILFFCNKLNDGST